MSYSIRLPKVEDKIDERLGAAFLSWGRGQKGELSELYSLFGFDPVEMNMCFFQFDIL